MQNEFFSYDVSEDNGGFYVMMYDLDRNPHQICFTKSKKVAEFIVKSFEILDADEEQAMLERFTN